VSKSQSKLTQLLLDVLDDTEVFGAIGACPTAYEPARKASSRILLISGDNAGGKSFFCKYLSQFVREETKMEVMRIGMEMRTTGGMVRSFVFGDEGRCSTGELTAHSILGVIHNSRQRGHSHMVCLDEPDVGLSEGYQAAAIEKAQRHYGYIWISGNVACDITVEPKGERLLAALKVVRA
jgi:hypothetical protein